MENIYPLKKRSPSNILGYFEHLLLVEDENEVLCNSIKNEMSKIGYELVPYSAERADAKSFLSKKASKFVYPYKNKQAPHSDLYNVYAKLGPLIQEAWQRQLKTLEKDDNKNESVSNVILNEKVVQNIRSRYSLEELHKIYSDHDHGSGSIFSMKTLTLIKYVSLALIIFSVFFNSIFLSIIAFVMGTYSFSQTAKNLAYEEGSSDGINDGYEYGENTTYLSLLENDMKGSYLHLWNLLYGDGYNNRENPDDKNFNEFLDKKIKEEEDTKLEQKDI